MPNLSDHEIGTGKVKVGSIIPSNKLQAQYESDWSNPVQYSLLDVSSIFSSVIQSGFFLDESSGVVFVSMVGSIFKCNMNTLAVLYSTRPYSGSSDIVDIKKTGNYIYTVKYMYFTKLLYSNLLESWTFVSTSLIQDAVIDENNVPYTITESAINKHDPNTGSVVSTLTPNGAGNSSTKFKKALYIDGEPHFYVFDQQHISSSNGILRIGKVNKSTLTYTNLTTYTSSGGGLTSVNAFVKTSKYYMVVGDSVIYVWDLNFNFIKKVTTYSQVSAKQNGDSLLISTRNYGLVKTNPENPAENAWVYSHANPSFYLAYDVLKDGKVYALTGGTPVKLEKITAGNKFSGYKYLG